MITRTQIRARRPGVERALAWAVLVFGFASTVAAGAGGWGPLLAHVPTSTVPWGAVLVGCGAQALLTWAQWAYYDKPIICWGARLIDALLTLLGNVDTALYWLPYAGTVVAFAAASLWIAIWPEKVLVVQEAVHSRQDVKRDDTRSSTQHSGAAAATQPGGRGGIPGTRPGDRLPDQRRASQTYVEQGHDAA